MEPWLRELIAFLFLFVPLIAGFLMIEKRLSRLEATLELMCRNCGAVKDGDARLLELESVYPRRRKSDRLVKARRQNSDGLIKV